MTRMTQGDEKTRGFAILTGGDWRWENAAPLNRVYLGNRIFWPDPRRTASLLIPCVPPARGGLRALQHSGLKPETMVPKVDAV